jgi:microcompartment protein CcmK/EutM
MMLARVTGRVWNERAIPNLDHRRLVTVQPEGDTATYVAVDLIDVSAPHLVLVATDEAAQAAVGGNAAGIDMAVVGLVAGADVVSAST